MNLDTQSTPFKIHWQDAEVHADSIGSESGAMDNYKETIRKYLDQLSDDAVHVRAYWQQLEPLLDDKEWLKAEKPLRSIVAKLEVFEDLFWGLELTRANGQANEDG